MLYPVVSRYTNNDEIIYWFRHIVLPILVPETSMYQTQYRIEVVMIESPVCDPLLGFITRPPAPRPPLWESIRNKISPEHSKFQTK